MPMNWMIYASFLLLPFAFIAEGHFGAGHIQFFTITAFAIAVSQIKDKFLMTFFLYIDLWVLVLALGTVNGNNILPWKTPLYVLENAFMVQIAILFGVIVYLGVVKSTWGTDKIANVICTLALIQGGIGLLQLWGFDPLRSLMSLLAPTVSTLPARLPTGTLGNPNFWAAFLAISTPFFFRDKWKLFVPIMIALVLSSSTSTAVISLAVGFSVLFGKPKIAILILALALVYGLFLDPRPIYASKRWSKWSELLNHWSESWWSVVFGNGPGSHWKIDNAPTFREWFIRLKADNDYVLPHSEWLHCLQQYGLIGLGFAIGYVLRVYRGHRLLFSAFVIAAINSIGNHPLHSQTGFPFAVTTFLIIIVAGLCEREKSWQTS